MSVSVSLKQRLVQSVKDYLEDSSEEAMLSVKDIAEVKECFRILKEMVNTQKVAPLPVVSNDNSQQVTQLRHLLREKEKELLLLVSLVNKKREGQRTVQTQTGAKEVPPSFLTN